MLRHMRTTVRLDEELLRSAKIEAAKRGETLTSMIEKGLRLLMSQPARQPARRAIQLPVCRAGGGTLPGVDISNSADLLDHMENLR